MFIERPHVPERQHVPAVRYPRAENDLNEIRSDLVTFAIECHECSLSLSLSRSSTEIKFDERLATIRRSGKGNEQDVTERERGRGRSIEEGTSDDKRTELDELKRFRPRKFRDYLTLSPGVVARVYYTCKLEILRSF